MKGICKRECLLAVLLAAGVGYADVVKSIAGEWTVSGEGLQGCLRLPGTLADAKLGRHMTENDYLATTDVQQEGALMREYLYLGKAVYSREVEVPADATGKAAEVFLERVMWQSEVFFDGVSLGARDSLATPHVHPVPARLMTPGRHRIEVAVDNSNLYAFSRWSHSYGPAMQSIWHGVLGRMELREANPLREARVFAEAGVREFRVEVPAGFEPSDRTVAVDGLDIVGFERCASPYRAGKAMVTVRLGRTPESWNEFHPRLYVLRLTDAATGFEASIRFGFRSYSRDGRALLVNGVRSFLRGNVDNCNFAKTGSPAMEKGEWKRILRTLKDEDGINAIRFHSWTPPSAAFEAADELGVYMLPEADIWVDRTMGKDDPPERRPHPIGHGHPIDGYVRAEMDAISDAYGNSPSFMCLAIGNELGESRWEEVAKWLDAKRRDDPRHLYFASTAREITTADDITVTHKLPGVGMVRERFLPLTDWDYEDVYSKSGLPTVAHEIGQWPVYPMWDFLGKFTGVLKPWNISRHQRTARTRNAIRFNRLYHEASAKTSRLIYKDEVESFLRTPSCSGVELLNVQDFTGQGEALIGWRDPFYDLKPGCANLPSFATIWNVTNFLARMTKYAWREGERFRVRFQVRNLGETAIAAGSEFAYAVDGRGAKLGIPRTIPPGEVGNAGEVSFLIDGTVGLGRHTLVFGSNSWNFWVFPRESNRPAPPSVTVTADPQEAADRLAAGGTVVYTGRGRTGDRDTFRSVYWTGSKTWDWTPPLACTLGTHVFTEHPALAGFPTEDWADWQWYDLVQNAWLYELEGLPEDFRPITLSVNDFHFSIFSSSLFEVRVGKGRLLACGYPIDADNPAAIRLKASLFDYLISNKTAPMPTMDAAWFDRTFRVPSPQS